MNYRGIISKIYSKYILLEIKENIYLDYLVTNDVSIQLPKYVIILFYLYYIFILFILDFKIHALTILK